MTRQREPLDRPAHAPARRPRRRPPGRCAMSSSPGGRMARRRNMRGSSQLNRRASDGRVGSSSSEPRAVRPAEAGVRSALYCSSRSARRSGAPPARSADRRAPARPARCRPACGFQRSEMVVVGRHEGLDLFQRIAAPVLPAGAVVQIAHQRLLLSASRRLSWLRLRWNRSRHSSSSIAGFRKDRRGRADRGGGRQHLVQRRRQGYGSWVNRSDSVSTVRSSDSARRCWATSSRGPAGEPARRIRRAGPVSARAAPAAAAASRRAGDTGRPRRLGSASTARPTAHGRSHQKLAADSAPVVLDQVQIGGRNADFARQFGLPEPGNRAAFADATSGQAVAWHWSSSGLSLAFQHLSAMPT